MTQIDYLDTQHNCICGFCGVKFAINVGDIYHSRTKPHQFSISCPACQQERQIEAFTARHQGLYPCKTATQVRADVYIEERHDTNPASADRLLNEMRIMSRHLYVLQRAAKQAVVFWNDEWDRACMPLPMEELEKTLKEVQVCDPDEYRR